MTKPGDTGLVRIIKATRYSKQGIVQAWMHEAAFRQEVALAVLLIPVAFALAQSFSEFAMLVGCCLLVLIVELLNSAIEATVDRHGHEFNELAGRAKDMGSAAVSFSLALTVLVWVSVVLDQYATILETK